MNYDSFVCLTICDGEMCIMSWKNVRPLSLPHYSNISSYAYLTQSPAYTLSPSPLTPFTPSTLTSHSFQLTSHPAIISSLGEGGKKEERERESSNQ